MDEHVLAWVYPKWKKDDSESFGDDQEIKPKTLTLSSNQPFFWDPTWLPIFPLGCDGIPICPRFSGLGFLQCAVLGTAWAEALPSPPVISRRQIEGMGSHSFIFSMLQSGLKAVGQTFTLLNSLVMSVISLTYVCRQGNISTSLPKLPKTYLNNLHKIQICVWNILMSRGFIHCESILWVGGNLKCLG